MGNIYVHRKIAPRSISAARPEVTTFCNRAAVFAIVLMQVKAGQGERANNEIRRFSSCLIP